MEMRSRMTDKKNFSSLHVSIYIPPSYIIDLRGITLPMTGGLFFEIMKDPLNPPYHHDINHRNIM